MVLTSRIGVFIPNEMTTIDAAIIKALVDHVGGDSSSIPDGTIGGGKTYTEGDGINIVNDKISVEFDTNTMELKNGALAAKTQIAAGDAISISNGKANVKFNTNTMELVNGALSVKASTASGLVPVSDVEYDTYDGSLGIADKFRVHFDDKKLVLGKVVRFLYDGVLQEYLIIRDPFAEKTDETPDPDSSIVYINLNDYTYTSDTIQADILNNTPRTYYLRIEVEDQSKVTLPTDDPSLGLFSFTSCDSRIIAALTTVLGEAIIERHKQISS